MKSKCIVILLFSGFNVQRSGFFFFICLSEFLNRFRPH